MPTHMHSIDLGRLDPPRWIGRRHDVRGRLFYLVDLEAIVVAQCRLDGGWRCEIVARRFRLPPTRIDVTDDDIAATPNLFPIQTNQLQPWEARMLWQAWTYQRFAAGQMRMLCRMLAEELRAPHTLTVDLHAWAVQRLIRQVHLRPPALRQLLRRLVNAGALTPLTPAREEHWGRHALIIPELLHGAEACLRIPAPRPTIWIATGELVGGAIR